MDNPKVRVIYNVTTSILAFAFFVTGTMLVVAYANGYRIGRDLKTVQKTGLVYVSSTPTNADLYINGEQFEDTPTTVSGLPEGEYLIQVRKDGYQDWNKKLSEERVEVVKNYLVSNGVKAAQLETVGYGGSKPAFSQEQSEFNRRVEFEILSK